MASDADRVWNRAALHAGGTRPLAGDRALTAVILAHGLVMNGGVAHALGCLSPQELREACDGFRRYGLDAIAVLFAAGVSGGEEAEVSADREYWRTLPDDAALTARFAADFAKRRDDYAD